MGPSGVAKILDAYFPPAQLEAVEHVAIDVEVMQGSIDALDTKLSTLTASFEVFSDNLELTAVRMKKLEERVDSLESTMEGKPTGKN